MTYEERREQEIKTEADRYARVTAIIEGIQIPGWVYVRGEDMRYGKLVNGELRGEIWFSVPYNEKDRIHISAGFPRDRNGQYYGPDYKETTPEISVAQTKTSAQVQKDIERRLLPAYLPMLAERVKRIQGHEGFLDKLSHAGYTVKNSFNCLKLQDGTETGNPNVSLSTPHDVRVLTNDTNVDIKLSSDGTAQLTLGGLTMSRLLEILAEILPDNETWAREEKRLEEKRKATREQLIRAGIL